MPLFIITSYGVVLILAVAISGYLSYEGLIRSAGEITVPLVAMLMLIILTMDAAISYFRSSERPYRLPILIWAIAAFFSIASNFNFLYSNFMFDDVVQNTITRQLGIFRDDLVGTETKIEKLPPARFANDIQTRLKVPLDNLKNQINDPLRPGCGEECRVHMAEIESILGQKITNLRIPPIGSSLDIVNDWYDRYKSAALAIADTLINTPLYTAIAELLSDIDNALLKFGSVDRVIATMGGLEALVAMAELSEDVERRANALLPPNNLVSHTKIDPTLGRLGEIVYAFENGFGERPNPMATAISLVLASVVDVLPFLLSFALFGPGRLERRENRGTHRDGSGRRRIIT